MVPAREGPLPGGTPKLRPGSHGGTLSCVAAGIIPEGASYAVVPPLRSLAHRQRQEAPYPLCWDRPAGSAQLLRPFVLGPLVWKLRKAGILFFVSLILVYTQCSGLTPASPLALYSRIIAGGQVPPALPPLYWPQSRALTIFSFWGTGGRWEGRRSHR